MKKSLILTLSMVFAISVAGTAFAAPGPFSDVPAKHWAYDAVTKLSKAGIVDGYGDNTFRGDKNMTRYEMAQIVGKAMERSDKADAANKALVEKLAAEFAVELNNLGVRVNKIEKKIGSIAWSGDAAIRYINETNNGKAHFFQENFRLALSAQINDNANMIARTLLIKQRTFGTTTPSTDNLIEAGFKVNNFFNNQGVTATLGRFNQTASASGFMMNYWAVDGAKIAFGNKAKVELGYASFKNPSSYSTKTSIADAKIPGQLYFDRAAFATIKYDASANTTVYGEYIKSKNGGATVDTDKVDLWGIGVAQKLDSDFTVKADYIKNQAYDTDNTAVYARLLYKGANPGKPQSWGMTANYVKAYANASFGWGDYNTTSLFSTSNSELYALTADYAFSKNIIFKVARTFELKDPATGIKKTSGE